MPSTQRITDPAYASQQQTVTHASFLKTGKLWWADDGSLSPQGVIYSTIDGQGGGLPIAAVDNASRVIKYVVTLGQRYQSYSLVDMRVQDINVVADLNRNDPNNPNPTEPVESDGTPSGQGDNAGGTQGVDTYLVEALQFMYSQWILISFWPALNYVVPGLDGNLRPSTSAPALISFAVDLLSAITVFSMSIVDFAFSLAQIDAGTLIGWIAVELAKDFFVVATFTSLYIGAYAAFRAADGFRIAQAYPAMAAAILAGGALFAAALALVEGFNMVGAIAGMENFWSMMFFLVLFLSCLSSALKGLPGNPVINALIAKGDNLVYWICMKLSIDLLSITDWNPVISCITGVFLLLTCVFFWFRFLYYLQLVWQG